MSFKDAGVQTDLVKRLMLEWSSRDLVAAADWLKGLPEGRAKDSALEGISRTWVSNDPKGAVEFATHAPSE
jgi:hypothetical protein